MDINGCACYENSTGYTLQHYFTAGPDVWSWGTDLGTCANAIVGGQAYTTTNTQNCIIDASTSSCIQLVGACCLTDGSCSSLTQTDCGAQGGNYLGDNTVCDLVDYYADLDNDGYSSGTIMMAYCQPAGFKLSADLLGPELDCNDDPNQGGAALNPGAPEVCDGIDNDCDSMVDDGDTNVTGQNTYYADGDGDTYGAGPPVLMCISSPPQGFSANNLDCNDGDGNLTIIGNPCDDGNSDTRGDYINNNCECVFPQPIPTLSQWGIIALSLIMLIFGLGAAKELYSVAPSK